MGLAPHGQVEHSSSTCSHSEATIPVTDNDFADVLSAEGNSYKPLTAATNGADNGKRKQKPSDCSPDEDSTKTGTSSPVAALSRADNRRKKTRSYPGAKHWKPKPTLSSAIAATHGADNNLKEGSPNLVNGIAHSWKPKLLFHSPIAATHGADNNMEGKATCLVYPHSESSGYNLKKLQLLTLPAFLGLPDKQGKLLPRPGSVATNCVVGLKSIIP
jgi:hypothetical protein